MVWYIDSVYVKTSRYYVKGQELPYCTKSGSKKDFYSDTSHGYLAAFGPMRCYVTRSVLATLKSAGVFEALRSQLLGVVPNDYAHRVNVGGDFPYCWKLKDGVVPEPLDADDACKDVSCPDKCVGVDKYNQVCQDGICVRGTLIETNSVHCGYTPDPTPDPTPTPTNMTYAYIALALVGAYMILRR